MSYYWEKPRATSRALYHDMCMAGDIYTYRLSPSNIDDINYSSVWWWEKSEKIEKNKKCDIK